MNETIIKLETMNLKKNHAPGSVKVQLIHSIASFGLISLYLVLVLPSDHLYQIGQMWDSPTLILFIGVEIIRMLVNRYTFQIEGALSTTKESTAKKPRSYMAIVKESLKIMIMFVMTSCVFAFFSIVLGAPAIHSYQETFTLAFLMTTLTLLPMCLHLGAMGTIRMILNEEFNLRNDRDEAYLGLVKHNAIVTIIGAWGGSVVVPLDWDRDWQAYPIPNVVGAILGFGFANLMAICQVGVVGVKAILRKNKLF